MSLDSTTEIQNTQSRTPLVKRLLLLMLVILVACAVFLFWRFRQYSQREPVLLNYRLMGGSYHTSEFIPEWIETSDLTSCINPKWFSQIDRLYCSSNEQLKYFTHNANLQYVGSLDLRADQESDYLWNPSITLNTILRCTVWSQAGRGSEMMNFVNLPIFQTGCESLYQT